MASRILGSDRQHQRSIQTDPYASDHGGGGGYSSSSGSSRKVNKTTAVLYGGLDYPVNRYDGDGNASDYFTDHGRNNAGGEADRIYRDDPQDSGRSQQQGQPYRHGAASFKIPRSFTTMDSLGVGPSTPVTEYGGRHAGGEYNVGVWSVDREEGLEAVFHVSFQRSMGDMASKAPPVWPPSVDVLRKILMDCKRHLHRLHPTAQVICDSAKSAGVIIPLTLEILGTTNSTPHQIGWRSNSKLDSIHATNEAGGAKKYMFITAPARQHCVSQLSLPYKLDLHKTFDTQNIVLHAIIGDDVWENVVSCPRNTWGDGTVLENSFAHIMLKDYDLDAREPGSQGMEDCIIDWKSIHVKKEQYGDDGQIRSTLTGVPRKALRYCEDQYILAKTQMKESGIDLSNMKITCEPVNGATWNSLAGTHLGLNGNPEEMRDVATGATLMSQPQMMSLLFRLSGFW